MQTNIYFIGIGGIGMSALARYFKLQGLNIAGYDRTESPLTRELQAEGIAITYADQSAEIPTPFTDPTTTRVVYTPAVPADSQIMSWFSSRGFEMLKRSRILGLLGEGKRVMAVAGTHGKTTTTTMLAHLNHVAAGQGSAFLGGISNNFGSNLVQGSGPRLAVEADEFDRSFLQLHPQEALITSIDADHLDIYGNYKAVHEAFTQFASQIKPGGALVLKKGLTIELDRPDIKRHTYHLDDNSADFHALNITANAQGYYTFDIVTPTATIPNCTLGIPGLINVENCIGATALLWQEGFDPALLPTAIKSFSGVERRFHFHINHPEVVYMDDYAHHPAELQAMLSSVRAMFPKRHLTMLFQPHLYTRTRDFATEFAQALSLADRVLMLDIYPARELPIEGVTSQTILNSMECADKRIVSKEQAIELMQSLPIDVMVTAGAGDIDRLCNPIRETLLKR